MARVIVPQVLDLPLIFSLAICFVMSLPLSTFITEREILVARNRGLLSFMWLSAVAGVAALLTPCVFPMIPFTMTYFLNRQSGGRTESVTQAGVFSGGIVLLFVTGAGRYALDAILGRSRS